MQNTKTYVAFLRGINVGGHTIKMEGLKKVFESIGLNNVMTLLASGNVLFTDNSHANSSELTKSIEEKLEKTYEYHIGVILRNAQEIGNLLNSQPFQSIIVTPQTRLYTTFLSEKPKSSLGIPYLSPEKDFSILSIINKEVCSVLTLSKERNTTDIMKILEKEYGKRITTRNWNTVRKIYIKLQTIK
jgi:uncharacterized protein (DUF1697 family)